MAELKDGWTAEDFARGEVVIKGWQSDQRINSYADNFRGVLAMQANADSLYGFERFPNGNATLGTQEKRALSDYHKAGALFGESEARENQKRGIAYLANTRAMRVLFNESRQVTGGTPALNLPTLPAALPLVIAGAVVGVAAVIGVTWWGVDRSTKQAEVSKVAAIAAAEAQMYVARVKAAVDTNTPIPEPSDLVTRFADAEANSGIWLAGAGALLGAVAMGSIWYASSNKRATYVRSNPARPARRRRALRKAPRKLTRRRNPPKKAPPRKRANPPKRKRNAAKKYVTQQRAYDWLISRGFKPVAGSSRYKNGVLTGRIEPGRGSGDNFYVTIQTPSSHVMRAHPSPENMALATLDAIKPAPKRKNPKRAPKRANPVQLPSEEDGGKPSYDDHFIAGYRAGEKAFARNSRISVSDAERAYGRGPVSRENGIWWIEGYAAAIDVGRGAYGQSGARIASRLGLNKDPRSAPRKNPRPKGKRKRHPPKRSNPLRAGYSRATVAANVAEMTRAGYPKAQAAAAALRSARAAYRSKHKRGGFPAHLQTAAERKGHSKTARKTRKKTPAKKARAGARRRR